MGCLLSRKNSRLDSKNNGDVNTIRGNKANPDEEPFYNESLTNGLSALRETAVKIENGALTQTIGVSKPLSHITSNSQTEFFRMLDEKIAKGNGEPEDSESER